MSTDDYPDTPIGGAILPTPEYRGREGAQRLADLLRAMTEHDEKVRLRDEIASARWVESVESSPYPVAMTRAQLNRLLHHGHHIPITKGITQRFIDEHYRGWTWNTITAVLRKMDVMRGGGGSPPYADPEVGAVHLDKRGSWVVQWEDGSITRSPGTPTRDFP